MLTLRLIASILLYPALLLVQAGPAPATDGRSEANTKPFEQFGEPHGDSFDDFSFPSNAHGRLTEIYMKGCKFGEHLTYMALTYNSLSPPFDNHMTKAVHGKAQRAVSFSKLGLKPDEYVTQVDLTTYRARTGFFHNIRRTRIGSIAMKTNKGNVFACGDKSSSDPKTSWSEEGFAFLYFTGSAGDSIDALAGHFIPVSQYFA